MNFQANAAGLRNRLTELFVDREFFMRADGEVRFIKISAKLQMRVAASAALVAVLLLLVSGAALIGLLATGAEQNALAHKQQRVARSAERVAEYRGTIDQVAHDLEARQDRLDRLYQGHFGPLNDPANDPAKDPAGKNAKPAKSATAGSGEMLKPAGSGEMLKRVSVAFPEAAPLARLEARQLAFVDSLSRTADLRSQRAEAAIRKFGLDPRRFLSSAQASGGPLIKIGTRADRADPRFASLVRKLGRMDSLEQLLAAIPTSKPAAIAAMTSNFGYRQDPFTGESAMHSGIDFSGASGTAILAASDGRVSFAGIKGGYGNCIEITHRGGIVTRYAHMRKLVARVGQDVGRGERIGEMGSTGRSTGTHLHFEVRLNGHAVNPAKFLKANPDVFKIQADVRNRARGDA